MNREGHGAPDTLRAMITLQIDGPVARLTLARPERRNAMNGPMWQALLTHCEALAALARARAGVRVLLLSGSPGLFCAGADLQEMADLAAQVDADAQLRGHHTLINNAQLALERLPLPTLALVDGPCIGGGFGLAAACDFRLATPRARLAITPARLGLVYSLEDTRRVVALVGAARARRLLLRSEHVDAGTALAWGMVDAVVAPESLESTAAEWAGALAGQSPTSLAGIKATVAHLSGDDAWPEHAVRQVYGAALHGPDLAEGVSAFLSNRPPRF
jgi:enoyl-CoA hydratase/carnithine racemase